MHNSTPISGELPAKFSQERGWTPQVVTRLKAMWADGSSCSEISRALGVTRNAVIGKVHRLKLRSRLNAVGATPPRNPPGDTSALRGAAWRPLPGIHPVGLLDLADGICRWPVTDGKPFLFCGARSPDGKPYCEHHQHISAGRGTPSEREPTRELRRAA